MWRDNEEATVHWLAASAKGGEKQTSSRLINWRRPLRRQAGDMATQAGFFMQPYEFFQKRGVAGPKGSVLFGSWWGRWNKVQGEEDLSLVKQFGPIFGEYAGRTPVLVATDPAVARAVLLDNANHFRSRRPTLITTGLLSRIGMERGVNPLGWLKYLHTSMA
ncbi:Cytochrome P450 [Gryllus bimaculatus]|nr:Cytochrome P450 [Gryllus bimaculatus]